MKEKIFKMYESIQIGKNEICRKCNANAEMEKPLSIYHIGEKFNPGEDTILFVGKTAVGGASFGDSYQGDYENRLFTDATNFGKRSLMLDEQWATRRPFYNYTHEIAKSYYGSYDVAENYIALSNIVKCNCTSTKDLTNIETKKYCINQLNVIWREIEILCPKRVVFYTGRGYDSFIKSYKTSSLPIIEDFEDCVKRIGKRNVPWLHRRFSSNNSTQKMHFLRTGHPERKSKSGFVNAIVSWMISTK